MLLETFGFERDWIGINMTIDTSFRRSPPAGIVVELETGSGAHDFAHAAYPHWVPELDRAVALGTAVAARAGDGRTIGFACHSVNRAGWIGPMATDPTLQHGGVGSAMLAGVVRRAGTTRRRDRRDLLGQQPAFLRQVRRAGVAGVPRWTSNGSSRPPRRRRSTGDGAPTDLAVP